jgi:hypothetical protein
VGMLMDPPNTGTSIYVSGYGQPMPVYVSNADPQIGPVRSRIFWGTVGLYGALSMVAGMLSGTGYMAARAVWKRLPLSAGTPR